MLLFYLSVLEDAQQDQFLRLYFQYRLRVYQVALSILKSPSLAQDAAQETWLHVIKNFSDLDHIPCDKTGGWIVTIVKNIAINLVKKESRSVSLTEDWEPPTPQGTEETAEYRRLVELIRSMPETYRGPLELRLICEWSYKEIGAFLGITETAATTRVSRGRAMLLDALEKEGYER